MLKIIIGILFCITSLASENVLEEEDFSKGATKAHSWKVKVKIYRNHSRLEFTHKKKIIEKRPVPYGSFEFEDSKWLERKSGIYFVSAWSSGVRTGAVFIYKLSPSGDVAKVFEKFSDLYPQIEYEKDGTLLITTHEKIGDTNYKSSVESW